MNAVKSFGGSTQRPTDVAVPGSVPALQPRCATELKTEERHLQLSYNRLQDAVTGLTETFNRLEARLEPLVRQEPCNPQVPVPPRQTLVPAAEGFMGQADRVKDLSHRLFVLLDHLEV